MIVAYICAGFGFAAMYLYAYRAGKVWHEREWPERIMALAMTSLLLFLAVAFIDVAHNQGDLLWRQWLVFGSLVAVSLALAWPRKKMRTRRLR